MELKEMTKEQMDQAFTVAQAEIVKLQAVQAEIAVERRRRRAAAAIEAKRAELAALEKVLGAVA